MQECKRRDSLFGVTCILICQADQKRTKDSNFQTKANPISSHSATASTNSQTSWQHWTTTLTPAHSIHHSKQTSLSKLHLSTSHSNSSIWQSHRLRPIDTHLALYTMLYNNSEKNRYAEPVLNKTNQILKIRD